MARHEYILDSDPGEETRPQPKKKRRRFDKLERAALVLSVLLFLTSLYHFGFLNAGRRKAAKADLPPFQLLKFPWPKDLPATYDPSRELRIQFSDYTPANRLEKALIVLRGPWAFGSTFGDSVALALGKPFRRGKGYLLYELNGGEAELTVLLNAGRLGTIVLAPNACGSDAGPCPQPQRWGLSKDQTTEMAYEPALGAGGDGMFENAISGLTYLVRPAEGRKGEWQIRAVYVQRTTPAVANPTLVRNVSTPRPGPADSQPPLSEPQYARLLDRFRQAIAFREKKQGADHPWVLYAKFELGRMQVESGHIDEGRQVILAAADTLGRRVGSQHPDVLAMRAWAEPEPKTVASRRNAAGERLTASAAEP